MRIRTRQIAHAGIFGSRDEPEFVSAKELEEIAETFADQKSAPVRLGSHWSEGRPRLGNVVAVRYDPKEQSLEADIEEHDTLAAAVDEGLYPDVSIGAKQRASDGRMYLHHLAYLGDTPPAIKDLYDRIDRDLGDAETGGILAADDDESRDFRTLPSVGAEKGTQGKETKTSKEVNMTEEEIAAMRAENERLRAEAEAKDKMLADRLAAEHADDKAALRAAAEGKVTGPQMDALMELADAFERGRTVELSDGAGAKKKCPPVRALAGILAALPKKVEPGVLSLSDPDGKDTARESLAAKMLGHI